MKARLGVWLVFALAAALAPTGAASRGTVRLVPDERAGWSPRRLLAIFRPGHYYGDRTLEIETSPPGATLDLFYTRANFQKLYEQAKAPVRVVLPRRADAGPRDAVTVRAFLEGFRPKSATVRVLSGTRKMVLELEPLPNRLEGLAYTELAGRGALSLLLKESPTLRFQRTESGFLIILAETARRPEVEQIGSHLRTALLDGVEAQQVGTDLLVRVRLRSPELRERIELRSRERFDPVREVYRYTVDLVPKDGGAEAVRRARAALARLKPESVAGCALRFDATLRHALDPEALAHALAPRGEFTDPFLRAVVRRLGELSPGRVVRFADGSRFHVDVPLELSAAASRASEAVGLLAALRAFVRELVPADRVAATLRGLLAPEMDAERFASALASAQREELSCQAASTGAQKRRLGALAVPRAGFR